MTKLGEKLAKKTSELETIAKQNRKDKNNDGWMTARTRLGEGELVKQIGDGNFQKGIRKLLLEHELMKSKGTTAEELRLSMLMDFTNDYLQNIKLVDEELADNHFANLPFVIRRYKEKGVWDPSKLKKKIGEDDLNSKKTQSA